MYHEVAVRLEKRLGLGEFPMVRRRLYARLQRLVEQKGDGPLAVIASLIQEAEGPKVRDKGQYFCFVVKRRLFEAGWPIDSSPGPNQSREQAAQVRAVVNNVGLPSEVDSPRQAWQDTPAELARKLLAQKSENDKLRLELARARAAQAPLEGGAW